ncbi:Maf family bZIP transcription factor [Flavobacteriaceae bacterium]|nr:Maf family bZIP transcription factor [Flavobacteriaceae bacterium]
MKTDLEQPFDINTISMHEFNDYIEDNKITGSKLEKMRKCRRTYRNRLSARKTRRMKREKTEKLEAENKRLWSIIEHLEATIAANKITLF